MMSLNAFLWPLECVFCLFIHIWTCSVSRLLRLIKVAPCLTHLITPFLFPTAAVLSLFSFFECLVKLQNPDANPLFSTSSLYFSDLSAFVPPVCFISLAVSLPLFFYNPQLSLLSVFLCVRARGGTAFVRTSM